MNKKLKTLQKYFHILPNLCTLYLSANLFDRVFSYLLVPFKKEEYVLKCKLKTENTRRLELINFIAESFKHLQFNPYQIGLAVCYADKFVTQLVNLGHKLNYRFMKSILIVSIAAAYKMTDDFCITNSKLEQIFGIQNISETELKYYDLVQYDLYFRKEDVEKYLILLFENIGSVFSFVN